MTCLDKVWILLVWLRLGPSSSTEGSQSRGKPCWCSFFFKQPVHHHHGRVYGRHHWWDASLRFMHIVIYGWLPMIASPCKRKKKQHIITVYPGDRCSLHHFDPYVYLFIITCNESLTLALWCFSKSVETHRIWSLFIHEESSNAMPQVFEPIKALLRKMLIKAGERISLRNAWCCDMVCGAVNPCY